VVSRKNAYVHVPVSEHPSNPSSWQVAEQPSLLTVLPSSHCSPISMMSLPHSIAAATPGAVSPTTSARSDVDECVRMKTAYAGDRQAVNADRTEWSVDLVL
jgi:hypothetical protein